MKISRAREKREEFDFDELFPEKPNEGIFWRAQRHPRPRRLSWPEPTPCPTCGFPVGAVTRMCAQCHFAGWWWT